MLKIENYLSAYKRFSLFVFNKIIIWMQIVFRVQSSFQIYFELHNILHGWYHNKINYDN